MVEKERKRRLTTATINQLVQEALAFKPPPRTRGGKRGRVYYCTQVLAPEKDFISWFSQTVIFQSKCVDV